MLYFCKSSAAFRLSHIVGTSMEASGQALLSWMANLRLQSLLLRCVSKIMRPLGIYGKSKSRRMPILW